MAQKDVIPKCGWCGSECGHVYKNSNGLYFKCANCGAPSATTAKEGVY